MPFRWRPVGSSPRSFLEDRHDEHALSFVEWVSLIRTVEPVPIGLYFARLWYAERLYPLIYALSACAAVAARR